MAVTTHAEDPPLEAEPPSVLDRRMPRKLPGRRSLRFTLGWLWLLDGLLQLQPFMFTRGFAHQVIAPVGTGQPFFVAGPVSWNAHLIAEHPAAANTVFASIQLVIGFSLLLSRSARAAIVASVLWATGVWYFGEGLGGVLGGHMTALLGAPGAALLYALLSCAAWPDRMDIPSEPGRAVPFTPSPMDTSGLDDHVGRLGRLERPAPEREGIDDLIGTGDEFVDCSGMVSRRRSERGVCSRSHRLRRGARDGRSGACHRPVRPRARPKFRASPCGRELAWRFSTGPSARVSVSCSAVRPPIPAPVRWS